jgi:hypothetical protein
MKGHDRDTGSSEPSATMRDCRVFPSLAKNSKNLESRNGRFSRFFENLIDR